MGISPRWVIGALISALGLLALFMASRAGNDSGVYLFGLLIFVFSVLFVFGLIGRYVGHHKEESHPPTDTTH